ncbi:hypothetical protein ACOSQ4_013582 [Xanthoceras sorbifolium]
MTEPFTFSAQSEPVIMEEVATQASEVLLSSKQARATEEHGGSIIRKSGLASSVFVTNVKITSGEGSRKIKPRKQSAEGAILIKELGLNSKERQQGTGYAKGVLKDKGKSTALCEEEDVDMEDSGVLVQFYQDIIAVGEFTALKNHHTLSADETMPYVEKSMVNGAVEGNSPYPQN